MCCTVCTCKIDIEIMGLACSIATNFVLLFSFWMRSFSDAFFLFGIFLRTFWAQLRRISFLLFSFWMRSFSDAFFLFGHIPEDILGGSQTKKKRFVFSIKMQIDKKKMRNREIKELQNSDAGRFKKNEKSRYIYEAWKSRFALIRSHTH